MASRSKTKTTFAKMQRERKLAEKRMDKKARKEARREAAESGVEEPIEPIEYPPIPEEPAH